MAHTWALTDCRPRVTMISAPDPYHPSMACLLGRMLFLAVAMTGPIAVACRFPIQPVLKGT